MYQIFTVHLSKLFLCIAALMTVATFPTVHHSVSKLQSTSVRVMIWKYSSFLFSLEEQLGLRSWDKTIIIIAQF